MKFVDTSKEKVVIHIRQSVPEKERRNPQERWRKTITLTAYETTAEEVAKIVAKALSEASE